MFIIRYKKYSTTVILGDNMFCFTKSKMVRFIMVSFCCVGSSLNALTLQEGVDEVLATHPIIQERLHNYQATLEDLRITESQYLPSLDYSGSFSKDETESPSTNFMSRSLSSYEHSLQLTQNLFNGFGTLYEADYQKARILAAANNYIENANDAVYSFVNQYITVQKARDTLMVAKENVTFNEEVFSKVKKLFDSGSTTRSEFEKIDTSLSLAQSNYIVAQNNLEDALFTLEKILGRYVKAEELVDVTFSGIIPTSESEMKDFAKVHNPSMLVTQYNIKAATAQRQASYKNYYPKIDLYARQSWADDISGIEGKDERSSVGIQFSYNFYRGGADEAQIAKNSIQISREQETQRDINRKLNEKGRLAWSAKTYIAQQLEYLQKYTKTSAKTLELYQQEYDLGRRTLLDLLVAQNDYVAARTQVIKAQDDLLFSNYRILDVMGTMVQNILGSKTLEYTQRVKLDVADPKLDNDANLGTLLFEKREGSK